MGDLITGALPMPSHDEMAKWIEHDQKEMAKRYVRSERHTMQVDYWRYIKTMKEARGQGRLSKVPLLSKIPGLR